MNEKRINQIKWFHNYDKETFGFETHGKKGIRNIKEIKSWGFTSDFFKDKTVLDIGAWDGYNSFYAEKMGASRVLAIDNPSWSGGGWGTKDGFNLVHEMLGSRVESLDINLFDITPENVGKFDIVLFLGVLYHLEDPLKGLNKASMVSNDKLIVETSYRKIHNGKQLTQEDPLFITISRPDKVYEPFTRPINIVRRKELFNNSNCPHKITSEIWGGLGLQGGRILFHTEK